MAPQSPTGRPWRAGQLVSPRAGWLLAVFVAAILAAGGPASRPRAAPSHGPEAEARAAVVTAMAINDLYLIAGAQLAFAKAATPEAKRAAAALLQDTKARYEALKNPALAAGVPLPTSVDNRRRQWLRAIGSLGGAKFDEVFAKQQLAGALETAALVKAYLRAGDGLYVKDYAADELPRLNGMISTLKSAGGAR